MFRVGMKVVCVKRGPWRSKLINGLDAGYVGPKYGEVLAIAEIVSGDTLIPQVRLVFQKYGITRWQADRFRPIVEKPTDIAIFTAMLTPKKVTERV